MRRQFIIPAMTAAFIAAAMTYASVAPCATVRDQDGKVVLEIKGAGSVPRLIPLLGDDRPEVSAQAMDALVEMDGDAVPELIVELKGPRFREVAIALGKIKDARAVVPLSEYINDITWEKAGVARGALRELGDASVPRMAELLKDSRYRDAAADVLQYLSGPRAVEAVAPLAADIDPAVRGAAILLLVKLGAPGAGDVIRGGLTDNDPAVRAKAAEAYMVSGERERQLLYGMLKDGDLGVRTLAANMLEAAPHMENFGPLLECYRVEKDGMARSIELSALGETGDARAVPLMLEALGDGSEEVVLSALVYFTEHRDERSVPAILKLYEGPKHPENPHVLIFSLDALKYHNYKGAHGFVLGYLGEGWHFKHKSAALNYLAETASEGDTSVADAVRRMLGNETDLTLRAAADRVLKRVGQLP
ncbi:MAG: HEAT repeat domain-containing protein [Nitrospirae bacterium]|nr:HEAT repeat domain-containing protein [Nitrospirota bacterium]